MSYNDLNSSNVPNLSCAVVLANSLRSLLSSRVGQQSKKSEGKTCGRNEKWSFGFGKARLVFTYKEGGHKTVEMHCMN
ncbi:hypothetical protein E2C01_028528 [Portunus trituberculatus]|uniref:Uncharacterized protein n=1 Tax=Portunus trituberculatus TaxID=210409 RepID=A0A5B7ERX9_PORTR|nr:hypothetical protein [Portunus trituberculatus]